jgi:hypothetical protein
LALGLILHLIFGIKNLKELTGFQNLLALIKNKTEIICHCISFYTFARPFGKCFLLLTENGWQNEQNT